MKICVVKATKRIIEMQSHATAGTLIQNAINAGYAEADVEEREVDQTEYAAAKAEDPVEIAAIIPRKTAEVNAVRDEKIAMGIPYAFPDGPGTIQTRDLTDARNIQTTIIAALILQASGETRQVMVFRDMEDISHSMTPADMLKMGVYVAQYGQAIYSASWTVKDRAKTMTAEEIKTFDVSANWPK